MVMSIKSRLAGAWENSGLLIFPSMLIGLYWGWSKLQSNEKFVSQANRRPDPFVRLYRLIKSKFSKTEEEVKIKAS